jgi:hypothetical protein
MPARKYLVELTPSQHAIVLCALRTLQAQVQHGPQEGLKKDAPLCAEEGLTPPGPVELNDLIENINGCSKLAEAPCTVLLQRCFQSLYETDFPELRDKLRKEIQRRLGVETNQSPFARRPLDQPIISKALIHKKIIESRKAAVAKRHR